VSLFIFVKCVQQWRTCVKVVIKSHMVNLWVRWLGIYQPVERLLTALDGTQVYGIGYFQSNANTPWQVTENSVVNLF